MQAIVTKYRGPTETRGSVIVAKCQRGSIRVPYDHSLNRDDLHREAAKLLIAKFVAEDFQEYGTPPDENPWNRDLADGFLPDGSMVFVLVVEAKWRRKKGTNV